MIEENPRLGKRHLEKIIGIPATTLKNYINKVLQLKKINLKFVPHFLTKAQKKERYDFCDNFLEKYGDMKKSSSYNIVTVDETWLYYNDP